MVIILKKLITVGTLVSLGLGFFCSLFYHLYAERSFLPFAITFWTAFYHFAMRDLTAYAVTAIRRRSNAADRKSFSLGKAERAFYRLIRIKKWKKYAPTYRRELFTVKQDNIEMLYHNMINAQLGHEIIVSLSFAPLLLSKPLDGFLPFLITSVLAALFDLQFVMIQRYNRDRVCAMLHRCQMKRSDKIGHSA